MTVLARQPVEPFAAVPFQPGRAHQLGPGDWMVGQGSGTVETLLGSCICLTLWHPNTRLGAACHIMLPEPGPHAEQDDPRYAPAAVSHMLRELRRRGANPRQCQAKLFGGGKMFHCSGPDIGQRNIDAVLDLLQQQGMAVAAQCVGRAGYRRVRFDLSSGAVEQRFDSLRSIADSFSSEPGRS
ncbi:chemotaxis protein CheD [Pseudomarimonas arenosa]|uniref:Probable chemoreceptor glutamine deamidase CheD n=1 Tax=Pseudomarimonas arenosa TaxID=2774145 RepID=A0AAW3ZPV8_9GAMM|nr:chemotaxis protein CheD [Pseudomarimonas arenosa]MBD8527199.1 chemotaxis protein CheD [Pseudomarimonas arenosa]